MTPLKSLEGAINDLNELNHKIAVYLDDWATLPIAVKTALKTRATTLIDEQIAVLNNIKTEIGTL